MEVDLDNTYLIMMMKMTIITMMMIIKIANFQSRTSRFYTIIDLDNINR